MKILVTKVALTIAMLWASPLFIAIGLARDMVPIFWHDLLWRLRQLKMGLVNIWVDGKSPFGVDGVEGKSPFVAKGEQ